MDFKFSTAGEIGIEIGRRLQVRRIALGLTQPELAARAGLSNGTISNIETRGQATLESLIRVAQALDVIAELQALFAPQPTSIAELAAMEKPARQRVSRKRSP